MSIAQEVFGSTKDGTQVDRYRLVNAGGLEASIITYGGIVTALRVPDRHGVLGDVVLGFDTLAPYLGDVPYFGALIGRYGNRIAHGRFSLNGRAYTLPCNDGPNHLHGGPHGFHRAVWSGQDITANDGPSVQLTYRSRDGEDGYPGNVSVTVVYTLTDQNALHIAYTATTDAPTVINLTNHSYFNLTGSGTILDHQLELAASHFLPVNPTMIPTGELRAVHGTPMDFMEATSIGARMTDDEQIRLGKGYDHCWVLDKQNDALEFAARLTDPVSGRVMQVETTQPGVQFYSGNLLDGSFTGKYGHVYTRRSGLCLETQHFPDAPNQPQFPSTLLRPGETYSHTTIYRFTA
ncbi:MAG: galactose mutarotase [Herpetosiphon sp.]